MDGMNTINLTSADDSGGEQEDRDTEIVWPVKGGILSLNSQKPRVQNMLHSAISKILIDVHFEHAFPEALKHNNVGNALIDCADALSYQDIKTWLCNDRGYIKELSSLVCTYHLISSSTS